MARWNHYPKFKIIKWDAYSILNSNPPITASRLKKINNYDDNDNFDFNYSIKSLIYLFEQIAASFTPIKSMSQFTKDKMYSKYKYSVSPTKIYMNQLNNKRVEVK